MRKSKKFYLGILAAMIMACMIAVPTIAAEYDADVQPLSAEDDAEMQEDSADEQTLEVSEASEETPDAADEPAQETEWGGGN